MARRKIRLKPGDLVCAKRSDDPLIKPNSCGVFEGYKKWNRKKYADVVFNFTSPFKEKNIVSASGGPTRLIKLSNIKPTKKKEKLIFWKWRRGVPGAGRGEYFEKKVNVFEVDLTKK